MVKPLAACALLLFGVCALRAQVVLNLDFTGPNTIVITATGYGPVTDDSAHTYSDGIDLEGLFQPADNPGSFTVVSSTLTTGDSSAGPVYDTAISDSLSESNADLNIWLNELAAPSQTFTFGQPAFSFGTSMTVTFSGLVFSGVDYGVVVAGYSGSTGSPSPQDAFADVAVSTSSTTPIGVYHVTGTAAPEPGTDAMFLAGAAALVFVARRKAALARV